MGRKIKEDDSYYSSLLKLIPSEMVALYIAVQAFLTNADELISVVVAVVFIIATPLWLFRFTNISENGLNTQEIMQLVASTCSMLIWIFSIGGPFASQTWYIDNAAVLVPLVMILWTGLVAPILTNKKPGLGLG